MATSLFFQPFFMLSGFTFPIRNMPQLAQWLTFLNPVRYFMEIVRGVFLQGAGVAGAVAADGWRWRFSAWRFCGSACCGSTNSSNS